MSICVSLSFKSVSLKMQILMFYTNKYLLDFFLKEFCFFSSFLNSLIIVNDLSDLRFSCVLQNESFAYLFLPNSCAPDSFLVLITGSLQYGAEEEHPYHPVPDF